MEPAMYREGIELSSHAVAYGYERLEHAVLPSQPGYVDEKDINDNVA